MHLAYRRQGRREGGREATDTGLIVWEETGWAGLAVNTTHVPSDRHSYKELRQVPVGIQAWCRQRSQVCRSRWKFGLFARDINLLFLPVASSLDTSPRSHTSRHSVWVSWLKIHATMICTTWLLNKSHLPHRYLPHSLVLEHCLFHNLLTSTSQNTNIKMVPLSKASQTATSSKVLVDPYPSASCDQDTLHSAIYR